MTDGAGAEEAVTTPEGCVEYVNRVGICSWRTMERLPQFPSLEAATPWSGADVTFNTWFWKDDLHIEKRLFYGQLLGSGVTAFVSLEMLPVLISAQGDIDPRDLYEKNRLSHTALTLYEHVARSGPTATSRLPFPPGSRQMHLAALQQRFLLTKHALTGRTRGTYGYLWGLCEDFHPEAFEKAGRIGVKDARQQILTHLAAQDVELTPQQARRLFGWTEEI